MSENWFKSLLRRRFIVALLLLVQLGFIIFTLLSRSLTSTVLMAFLTLLSLAVCLSIISKRDKGAFKLTWVFLIMLFPLFGGLFYLLFRSQSPTKKTSEKVRIIVDKAQDFMSLPGDAYDEACAAVSEHAPEIKYLQNYAGYPVYSGSSTEYLSPGEAKYEKMLEELEKAEKYIFLEYFIIQEGQMWNSILDILRRKAAQGVKVRVMYDDMGCFLKLPEDYPKTLGEYGIECIVFNPFRPVLSSIQNNRDHRKIAVIDGKVAFTGGVNLADEYINSVEKFGHWKDAAVLIKGKAAWSFTLIFLQMWSHCTKCDEDFMGYYPWQDGDCPQFDDGFVQPYADTPTDKENVGEHVYLHMINRACDYVYINTPYLIIDDSMVSALCLAAKSGVDVRIVTPHKWDKRLVHMTTRSYYRELIQNGVKIYEYSKGFIHSKTFVCDDTTATIGTTNLDFRSLYLHFECGVWMYKSKAVMQLKEDFLNTLDQCQLITEKDCHCNVFMRQFQEILRLFAPLM